MTKETIKEQTANAEAKEETREVAPVEENAERPSSNGEPRYSVKVGGEWQEEVVGDIDYAGSLGHQIEEIRIDGVGKYRVYNRKTGWSDWSDGYASPAGNGNGILKIELEDKDVRIGVHVKGGSWLDIAIGEAGCMLPIDAIWMARS